MSLNTAHAFNGSGVVLYNGERILLYTKDVRLGLSGGNVPSFKGEKKGRIFLTTHRIIFINDDQRKDFQSFSIPFGCMREVELEQPVFGANHIKGKVLAETNGNWVGSATFKLWFYSGGAIEFGQAMMRTGKEAIRAGGNAPPPYTATGNIFQAPPPAYSLVCGDPNYGWLPYSVFPTAPPSSDVYMTDAPPPYPGMGGYSGYAPPPAGYAPPPANGGPPAGYGIPTAYYDQSNPHVGYSAVQSNPTAPPPAYGEAPDMEKKRL